MAFSKFKTVEINSVAISSRLRSFFQPIDWTIIAHVCLVFFYANVFANALVIGSKWVTSYPTHPASGAWIF